MPRRTPLTGWGSQAGFSCWRVVFSLFLFGLFFPSVLGFWVIYFRRQLGN